MLFKLWLEMEHPIMTTGIFEGCVVRMISRATKIPKPLSSIPAVKAGRQLFSSSRTVLRTQSSFQSPAGCGREAVRLLPACSSGDSPNVRLLWSERMVKSAEAAVRLHCRARRVESSVGILIFLGCRLSSFLEPDWGVRYKLGSLGTLAVPDPWALTILDTSKEREYPNKGKNNWK